VTTTTTAPARPAAVPAVCTTRRAAEELMMCPPWCDPALHERGFDADVSSNHTLAHQSNPRVWDGEPGNDTPRYSVQFWRGDEVLNGRVVIGQTIMSVAVNGGYDAETDAEGHATVYGNLSTNDARRFARWLNKQAREIDPKTGT